MTVGTNARTYLGRVGATRRCHRRSSTGFQVESDRVEARRAVTSQQDFLFNPRVLAEEHPECRSQRRLWTSSELGLDRSAQAGVLATLTIRVRLQ